MYTRKTSLLIGMLLLSAIALAISLAFVGTRQAQANMMSQSGEVVLITTGAMNGGDEILHVIDMRTGKIVSYGYNQARQRMQAVAGTTMKEKN